MTTTIEKATLGPTLAQAHALGWEVQHLGGDKSTERVMLRRDPHEWMVLTAWTFRAGGGGVHCLHGQLATGQVSTGRIERQWNSSIAQTEMDEWLAVRLFGNNSGHMLAVSEGEYVSRWETASNYTVHQLRPGLYPIEMVSIGYYPCDPAKAYYAIARVRTDEVRRHYVDRFMTASEVHDEEFDPPRPSSISWQVYAYQMPGRNDSLPADDRFRVVPA